MQSSNTTNEPKTLKSTLGFIQKLNAHQLSKLIIEPPGEYHKLPSAKVALDVMNHIKGTLKTKGFGVYCLHNGIWVVPFVHPDIVMPDFQRAWLVLPNNKAALMNTLKVEPQQPAVMKTAKKWQNPWLTFAIALFAIWCFV